MNIIVIMSDDEELRNVFCSFLVKLSNFVKINFVVNFANIIYMQCILIV